MEISPAQLTSLKQYLTKSKHSLPAAKFNQEILNAFDMNIKSGSITIPQEQKPLPIALKVEQNEFDDAEKKLQEIHDKKQAIKRQMQLIHSEQEKIMGIKLSQSKTSTQKYFKSKMTAEDKEKLKTLHKAKKIFQHELEQKTCKFEQNLKKIYYQNQRNVEEERKKEHMKKKEQVQKSIQLMEKRRQEQKTLQAEQNKKLKSLLQQKKLYEQMQKKWKEVEEEQLKKKQEMKEELKKIRRIDFEEIKEHEKKYEESMRLQRESRVKNIPIFEMDESRSQYQSRFIDSIKEQELKMKEFEQMRRNKLRELSEKKKEYGEQVRTVHKPNKFMKKEDKQNESKLIDVENRSLSLFETHEKGNNYMREVNTKLSENLKQHPENRIKKEEPKAFKYTNYLAQIKTTHNANSDRKGNLHQIAKIMKNQNISHDDRLFKAKLLAEKIENNRGDKQSDQNLLSSINAKLAILKQLD